VTPLKIHEEQLETDCSQVSKEKVALEENVFWKSRLKDRHEQDMDQARKVE